MGKMLSVVALRKVMIEFCFVFFLREHHFFSKKNFLFMSVIASHDVAICERLLFC